MSITTGSRITKVAIYYVPRGVSGRLSVDQMDLVDMPALDHCRRPANHPRNLQLIWRAYQVIDGSIRERCVQLKQRSMRVNDCIQIDGFNYYVSHSNGFDLVANVHPSDRVWVCPACEAPVSLLRSERMVEELIEAHEQEHHGILAS